MVATTLSKIAWICSSLLVLPAVTSRARSAYFPVIGTRLSAVSVVRFESGPGASARPGTDNTRTSFRVTLNRTVTTIGAVGLSILRATIRLLYLRSVVILWGTGDSTLRSSIVCHSLLEGMGSQSWMLLAPAGTSGTVALYVKLVMSVRGSAGGRERSAIEWLASMRAHSVMTALTHGNRNTTVSFRNIKPRTRRRIRHSASQGGGHTQGS